VSKREWQVVCISSLKKELASIFFSGPSRVGSSYGIPPRSSGGVAGETCVIKNRKRSEKGRNMQCEGRKRGVMWLNGIV